MIVRYIILKAPLQVPGAGSSKRWTANGLDGTYRDAVKTITETERGCVFDLPTGQHKGPYLVPWHEIAMVSYHPEAPAAPVITTDDDTKPQRITKPKRA